VVRYIIKQLDGGFDSITGSELSVLYDGELNPVAAKAQKKVPVPEGLDLDAWINDPPSESEEEAEEQDSEEGEDGYNVFVRTTPTPTSPSSSKSKKKDKKKKKKKKKGVEDEEDEKNVVEARQNRLHEQSMNPNYLKEVSTPVKTPETPVEDIPIQQLDLSGVQLQIPGLASTDQYFNISRESSVNGGDKKKKKKKKKGEEDDKKEQKVVTVRKASEMPEGVELSEGDSDDGNDLAEDDPHKALGDISLDDLEYNAPYKPREEDNSYDRDANGGVTVPHSLFGAPKGFGGGGDSKKKKKKEDKPVAEEEVEKKKRRKKEKKEKKKKREKDNGEKEPQQQQPPSGEVPGTDDMDFWLSNDVVAK
jgi:AP-3 complex subunit delta-1